MERAGSLEMPPRGNLLLASTAHDLKEPLEAIVMGACLLLRSLPGQDTPARTVAEAILRSAERVSDRVDDLYDLTLLDAGALEVRLDDQSAEAIAIQAVSRWVRHADRRRVVVELQIDRGLRVRADRTQLVRVLGKLLDNAIRFSPVGGRVRLGVEPAGTMARFDVVDEGPGIGHEQQRALFERDARSGSGGPGSPGLSLLLVKGVIELHGGQVAIRSEPGKGSTFSFTVALA